MKTSEGHELLTLSEAAKALPSKRGARISTSTLWRWTIKGACGTKLRHYRFGRRVYVTVQDLLDFGQQVAERRAAQEGGGQ